MAKAKTTLATANANENTLLDFDGLDEYTKKLILKLLGLFALKESVPNKTALLNALGYEEVKNCRIYCEDGSFFVADILATNVRDNRVGYGKIGSMQITEGSSET